ncbi:TonB-dependent receptor [Asticcacaulis benevestitus]|uniref:TonB-denpendent receptor n=1 Tax=Asticcacaulis benevestitus DSM 16100 = ATCC BAA-896 TaxID=1121022 RepID=V4PYZ4_9CAUL|nr:TonB-dependent receptor [Asticcacaulis benevestitus]ESQ92634.1 TonB-denpendent receptor [Asticcacaulis benevestitus DSM 16100 = ATCC BAA-896]
MLTTSRYQKWLISSAAVMALSFAASLSQAQETAPAPEPASDEPIQEVVVVGVRGSVARAVKLKRDATTVQDSISALELGMFPDDNVADSLSHITGVSISRTAGGEGQKVSVRGLGPEYTLSTFNGRILATDGAGRDFAYDVLPSDVISGADVIKGAEAANTEGAIGGLINLRSASPFDKRGPHGIVRIEGDRNQMSDLDGKKLSGVYSTTFADDKFGVLLGVVLEERDDRTDIAGNDGGWTRNPVPDTDWYGNAWGGNIDPNNNGKLDEDEYGLIAPGQFRVGSILEQKKRSAYTAKLEWRPSDNFRLVVDGLTTKLDSPQVGYQQSFYPLYAPGRWSNMQIQNGIVTSFDMDNPDPEMRLNPELLNQTSYRVVDTSLYGVNAAWNVSDSLTLTGDLYRSTSSRHSGGQDSYVVLRMNQANTAHIELTGAYVPNVTVNFDDGRDLASGLAKGQFTDSDFNTHYFSLAGDNIDDEINGAAFSGKWQVGKSWFDSLQFGLNYTDRKKSRDLVNNSLTGGADYYSGDNAINVGDLNADVISHSFSLPNFMSEVSGNFPRTFLAFDIASYQKALAGYDGNLRLDGEPYDYAAAAPVWNPLQSYRVGEKTWSGYVQANLEGERWSGNVGVRVVQTNTTAQAWDAKILDIIENGAFNFIAVYADPTSVQQDNKYTYILPSANLNYRITDELRLRLGAARTMARPSVETLAPTNTTESISWGEFTQIYGGNAALKPYSADQFDASLEWYFSKNSILNFAAFSKHIEDQITRSWEPGQDIGVPGHLFNISRPINGDYAKVKGIEIGLQHFLDNGLGVRAQYTRNWSKSWVGDEERPLEGIAPSVYSLGVFYDHGKVSLSLTGDHTDGFVTAINVLGAGYNEQSDPITWVTAHASYKVNDSLDISLEGQNLLDEANTYSINGNPLLPQGYNRYGASYKLGVSYRF